ncbi:DNA recombination protein RmuC [Tsukamurella soli]
MDTTYLLIAAFTLLVGVALGWLGHARYAARGMRPVAASDLSGSVTALVAPLRQTIDALGRDLMAAERSRVAAFAGLREQIGAVARTSDALRTETSSLRSALRSPQVRGRWGELQLERVVELAGLGRHCDFTPQMTVSVGDARLRPDLVVHLSGGRDMVIDAKVPLDAYLAALDAPPAERPALLVDHARRFRSHVTSLTAKRYWEAVGSPELVVMFVPAEPFLDAALEVDPELLEFALERNVALATPTTLVAMLRAVALAWRQHALTEDAARIHALGSELSERLDILNSHFTSLGSALDRTVDAFNATVGSYNARVAVTARRLGALGSLRDTSFPDQTGVESVPRAVPTAPHPKFSRD